MELPVLAKQVNSSHLAGLTREPSVPWGAGPGFWPQVEDGRLGGRGRLWGGGSHFWELPKSAELNQEKGHEICYLFSMLLLLSKFNHNTK
jgi:hypothetical protein